jgi:sortase (surface protein transpeptidase)
MALIATAAKIWRQPQRWWVVSAILLLIAAGTLAWGLRGGQHSLSGPAAPPISPPATTAAAPSTDAPSTSAPSTPASAVVARSTPVALRIPAIGVTVSLSKLGLNPDHTVEVPTNFQQPGWYRLGPSPGQLGSAVILGHVDSHTGPAVFFRLRSLRGGDHVEVSLADGVVVDFVVTSVATYPKSAFPSRLVYGSHGTRALNLVTCGGVFDPHAHSYLSNVVAFTSLVAISPPAVAP